MIDISPVLEFVSRTGEHCVFFNPEDRSFVVLMPLKEYERMAPKKMAQGMSKQGMGSTEPYVEPWQPEAQAFTPEPPV